MITLNNFKKDYLEIKSNLDIRLKKLFKHNIYILGPEVKELEKKLSIIADFKYCIAVANGSDAIHLSLRAMNLPKGSEVIVPALSWISSASSILLAGLKPVFVDVNMNNGCISEDDIKNKITLKTRCIISVNLYGNKPDYNKIYDLCKKRKIKLIEDAAQSFGSNKIKIKGTDILCTSFFPAKTLGCYGDGGACFTNNFNIYKKIIRLRSHGQVKKSYASNLGTNSRLDTIQACVLLSKIPYYEFNLKKRFDVAKKYKEYTSHLDIKYLLDLNVKKNNCTSFPIIINKRSEFVKFMKLNKIEIGTNYPYALTQQPLFKKNNKKFKIANYIAKNIACLPINPYMKKSEIRYVVNKLETFILKK